MTERLVWEGTLEPTGTLFLDDLRDLEELLRSEGATTEWTLQGKRELGSGQVTSSTISGLADLRNRLLEPETLELNVEQGSEYRDREYFKAQVRLVEDLRAPGKAWTAEVTATSEYLGRFERSVRGIKEIFTRASQTTWARQHATLHSASRHAWVVLLFGGIFAASSFFEALQTNYRWIAVTIASAYLLTFITSELVKRRLDASALWNPAHFDLRNARSLAQQETPPEILSRDVVIASLGVLASVVGGTIVAAIFTQAE